LICNNIAKDSIRFAGLL